MERFHHSGDRPVRVLLIGDRRRLLQVADGTTLAARVADRIWLATRRGVDLDVLTDLAPVLRAVHGVFTTWRLWRYDVLVVVVDARRGLARVGTMLEEVLADAAAGTDVVLAAPVGGAHDGLRLGVGALASPRLRFVPVPTGGDGRTWSAAIGEAVTASLVSAGGGAAARRRAAPQDEAARQRALDEVGIVGAPPEPRLDDLVELARAAFGTEFAEINFIDRDRQWKMAAAGGPRGENPRAHSFCNLTIRRPEPTVVPDARFDPELWSNPMVTGPDPVLFYAAHPIESAAGYRIGSFCVYDHEPRDVRGLDLAVLRDLALLAQAEIIAHDSPPVGIAPQLAAR